MRQLALARRSLHDQTPPSAGWAAGRCPGSRQRGGGGRDGPPSRAAENEKFQGVLSEAGKAGTGKGPERPEQSGPVGVLPAAGDVSRELSAEKRGQKVRGGRGERGGEKETVEAAQGEFFADRKGTGRPDDEVAATKNLAISNG